MKNPGRSRRAQESGSIFQRKDGRWCAQVLNPAPGPKGSRYLTRYAKTKAQAVEALNKLIAEVASGRTIPTQRDSVAEYLDQWLDSFSPGSKEPKTVTWYRMMVEVHLKPGIGKVELRKLQPSQVQSLINSKLAEGLSASTVRGIHAVLRTALNQAWKWNLVAENVALKVSLPKSSRVSTEYLNPAEAAQLIEALKGAQIEGLVKLALATGMRIGEVTGLRWKDIDESEATIRVEVQLQRIGGKLALKALKSWSSHRTLHLSSLAQEALRIEKDRQAMLSQLRPDTPFNSLGLVFLNSEGHPFDPKNVNDHLAKACERAGLRRVSFHKLRHTAATLMVAAGVDLHQVKEQLGHSQISLTANLYAHGVSEAQKKAANRLDEVLRMGKLPPT